MSYAGMTKAALRHEQDELLRRRDAVNKWGDLKASSHGTFLKDELTALKDHAKSSYKHIPAGETIAPILLAKLQEREKTLSELIATLNDTETALSRLDNECKEVRHWITVKDDEPPIERRQSIHQGDGEDGRS